MFADTIYHPYIFSPKVSEFRLDIMAWPQGDFSLCIDLNSAEKDIDVFSIYDARL